MPPTDRFVITFAAEPPQEELPYGRWQERLRDEFLAAARRIDAPPQDLGEPQRIVWYPDRSWHGRTFVPATARTSGGYELFGYRIELRLRGGHLSVELILKRFELLRDLLGAARGDVDVLSFLPRLADLARG